MSDLNKIPVTVITGFLGAGKTTLIRHLMQNPQGKRLAVLVNEFGTAGVDGDILKSCADENCPENNIVELANGCICCTVADDFIPTIEALMALPEQPEHILIETSGLALPKPLLKAFDWPAIKSRITVDGVIAVADAEAVAAGRFAPDVAAVDAQRELVDGEAGALQADAAAVRGLGEPAGRRDAAAPQPGDRAVVHGEAVHRGVELGLGGGGADARAAVDVDPRGLDAEPGLLVDEEVCLQPGC